MTLISPVTINVIIESKSISKPKADQKSRCFNTVSNLNNYISPVIFNFERSTQPVPVSSLYCKMPYLLQTDTMMALPDSVSIDVLIRRL